VDHFSASWGFGCINALNRRNCIPDFKLTCISVRFQVLMAANLKISTFWSVALCSLVKIDHAYRPDDEGNSTSETSVYFCETTRRSIPENSYLRHAFQRCVDEVCRL
jgi:hypothetical protein